MLMLVAKYIDHIISINAFILGCNLCKFEITDTTEDYIDVFVKLNDNEDIDYEIPKYPGGEFEIRYLRSENGDVVETKILTVEEATNLRKEYDLW